MKKAIIPAAGLGTRFLPATKALPKEMLPIVDKPTIQYVIEEAVASGIEDIIIVTGRGKRAIEDHFDKSWELEHYLREKGKIDLLQIVKKTSQLVNIHYVRQKEPLGLGHAIYCARKFINGEPFAVLLGDDLVVAQEPCLKQLINKYSLYKTSIVGVQEVRPEDVNKYGIVKKEGSLKEDIVKVAQLIEKPSLQNAPSNLAIMGRYIIEAKIFEILENLPPGKGGEIQLTDALNKLNQEKNICAYNFKGIRYDVGDKQGFLKATIEYALAREDLREDFYSFLQQLLANEKKLQYLKENSACAKPLAQVEAP